MDVPDRLQEGIEQAALEQNPRDLFRAVETLSSRYRSGHAGGEQTYVRSDMDAVAYAVYRLPATYAAVSAALRAVKAQKPEWQPSSLLDLGAGPGTATWAALEVFPSIQTATLVERDRNMVSLGKRLLAGGDASALSRANWLRAAFSVDAPLQSADLVVAAYMLGELPLTSSGSIVAKMWDLALDTLVIVEPGTPAGFALIRDARRRLLAGTASVVAPCPHGQDCPMAGHDWCHFSQRITRTPRQRQMKRASLPYEDEKYSYVAVARQPAHPIGARVIRHPQIRSGHVYLDLCTPSGLDRQIVTRKNRLAFREARALHWGSTVATEPGTARDDFRET